MSCDVGKATEMVGEWASPTSQLISNHFHCFTYVTAHSLTLPLLHLCHSSFSSPSFASLTSPGEPPMQMSWSFHGIEKRHFHILKVPFLSFRHYFMSSSNIHLLTQVSATFYSPYHLLLYREISIAFDSKRGPYAVGRLRLIGEDKDLNMFPDSTVYEYIPRIHGLQSYCDHRMSWC